MASLFFHFCLFVSIILPFSKAYNFNVGGKNGWTVNPPEDYNHWAERNRFQVNDTLTFRYKKGADSVLVVKKDDYYKCNTNDPVAKFDSGTSVFQFDRSGPFFFISGNHQNCQKGQRLIVVVLAVRPPKSPSTPGALSPANSPSSTVSPSPESNSPSSSVSPSPAANSPQTNSPSPSSFLPPSPESSSTPTVAPSPAANSPESSSSPTVSPSPASNSPESSSSPTVSPSPAANSPESSSSPTVSPSPAANSPASLSPAGAPGTSPAADTPGGSLAPEPASDSGETADVNSPAPTKSGSPAVTASKRMMVTAVVVVVLGFVIV